MGNQGRDTVRDHFSRLGQPDFRATTHDQHQRIRSEGSSLIDGAVIILEIFLPAGSGRARKHASAANAGDMQACVFHMANARAETRLFDLVPPERNGGNAVAHAAFDRLADTPGRDRDLV